MKTGTLFCIMLIGIGVLFATGARVQGQAISFDEWAQQLPEGVRGPQDNSDGDTSVNLVEYAYGLNPLEASEEGLPTVKYSDGIATFSYTKPKSAVGIKYLVRVSDNVTLFEQPVTLIKTSETETTETWAVAMPADGSSQFAWNSLVKLTTPLLVGHEGASRPEEFEWILPYEVQAAFNNDTFFWHISYPGDEGTRHEYIRYTDGAWTREGGDRRDAQGTIDEDVAQGDQTIHSTIYEQRTSIMVNDPTAISNVTNFDMFGCYLTCHNTARHMPEWTSLSGHDSKYVDPSHVSDGAVDSAKVLDLWHWRGARSNPIGRADDQNILSKVFEDTSSGDDGGRKGDAGTGVFTSQSIVDGHPQFVFDPGTAGGNFVFNWENFWATPLFYITQPDAADSGPNAPNPVVLAWDDAVAAGYVPSEGDTVPRRVLRAGAGSRADITSDGTRFIRETPDTVFGQEVLGIWSVQMQRLLDTENDDDVALVPGNTYEVGFEVHLWEYTTRDHYVSFPMTLSLGSGGDIEAVDLRGEGADGKANLPNWEDTDTFPVTRIDLFQPGIATWEFLAGENSADSKVYIDPETGSAVDQSHGGAGSVAGASQSCTACHGVRIDGPAPPLFDAGSMEELSKQRGGIWTPTPIVQQ